MSLLKQQLHCIFATLHLPCLAGHENLYLLLYRAIVTRMNPKKPGNVLSVFRVWVKREMKLLCKWFCNRVFNRTQFVAGTILNTRVTQWSSVKPKKLGPSIQRPGRQGRYPGNGECHCRTDCVVITIGIPFVCTTVY